MEFRTRYRVVKNLLSPIVFFLDHPVYRTKK